MVSAVAMTALTTERMMVLVSGPVLTGGTTDWLPDFDRFRFLPLWLLLVLRLFSAGAAGRDDCTAASMAR